MKRILVIVFALSTLASCKSKKATVAKGSPEFEWSERSDRNKPIDREPSNSKDKVTSLRYSRSELEDFLEEWWGVPHRMGGMTQNGVDCSGLVCVVYKDLYNDPFQYRRAQDIYTELEPIRRDDELEVGDLIFFRIGGVRIDHVGIYLGNGDFAHASSSKGVMVSNLSQDYWKKRFFRGGRKP